MWLSLIGFMGAGKTSVGEVLARRALLEAVDLDALIVEREGRDIPGIFADGGESAFRDAEAAALESLDRDRELVVSCGGGVIERPGNVELLRERGAVVWLDVPFGIVRRRLDDGSGDRPLVRQLGWPGLDELHRRRLPLYAAAAHFRLKADRDDPETLARRVLACRTAMVEGRRRERT